MSGLNSWSATPGSNASVGSINWAEGQNASTVNNSARQLMADVADVVQGTAAVYDTWTFCDPTTTTKKFRFDGGSVSAGATVVVTVPNVDLTFSDFSATFLDDTSAGAVRSTLGLVIGTDVLSPTGDGSGLTGVTSRPGFRNRLINGGMAINQRAAASNADDTYAFDRWNILTQTGTVAASQVTDAENGTPYMMRITQSQASAQRFGVEQIIEAVNCKDLRGQAVVLSARVRCSASTTLRYAILEWTSTADSVTSDVVNDWTSATYTAGNFFLASNLTVTATGSIALTANTLADITELTGTLGSIVNNVIVLFWTDSTQAQNVTLDISKVQLEAASAATAFEKRHNGVELELCQRYFQINEATADYTWTAVGQAYTTAAAIITIPYKTEMRISPTITMGTAGTGAGNIFPAKSDSAAPSTVGSIAAATATKNVLSISCTGWTSAFAAGNATGLVARGPCTVFKADAEI